MGFTKNSCQEKTDAKGGTVTEFVVGNAYIYNAALKLKEVVNVIVNIE